MAEKVTSKQRRTERRRKIAEEFKRLLSQGKEVPECFRLVTEKYRAAIPIIRAACRENQIKIPRTSPSKWNPSPQTFEIVAELIRGRTMTEIAAERGLSRQRVHQIKQQARGSGILKAVQQRVKEELEKRRGAARSKA
jgi:hypothetical protein